MFTIKTKWMYSLFIHNGEKYSWESCNDLSHFRFSDRFWCSKTLTDTHFHLREILLWTEMYPVKRKVLNGGFLDIWQPHALSLYIYTALFQIIPLYICLNVCVFFEQDKDVARLQDFQELEVVLEKTESLSLFSGGQGGLSDRPCYNMKASRLTY